MTCRLLGFIWVWCQSVSAWVHTMGCHNAWYHRSGLYLRGPCSIPPCVKPMLHCHIIVLRFSHFYSFTKSVQRYALYCMLLYQGFFSIVICALMCLASRTIDRSRNHIFLGYNVLIHWLTLHCVLTSTGSLIFSLRNDPNRKIRDTTGFTLLPLSRSIFIFITR